MPTAQAESRTRTEERRSWLTTLALADGGLLQKAWDDLSAPSDCAFLRRPEIGLAMVRGRAGGSGAAFNLGEMTVTRCVVTARDSVSGARIDGIACVAGRDPRRAELVARFDAAFQDRGLGSAARDAVLHRLSEARREAEDAQAAKTRATQVEFFTMERGH